MILAVPPGQAQELLPGLSAPDEFRAIVNGHFALPAGQRSAKAAPITGLIGGTAQWLFVFEDRVSVTVSGADALVDDNREDLAERLWADVRRACLRYWAWAIRALPPWQIVKERRATFAATPEQDAKRPGARTALSNLLLAGELDPDRPAPRPSRARCVRARPAPRSTCQAARRMKRAAPVRPPSEYPTATWPFSSE